MHERPETVTTVRPWGTFQVIGLGEGYQVKRIAVLPTKRLSYQLHRFRAEHWYVVGGVGTATVDGRSVHVEPGESVDIAVGIAHRIENTGRDVLVMIEVQLGSYLGEDDIVRIEDDFGRATAPE